MTRNAILGSATILALAAVFTVLGCYLFGCGLAMLPGALFVGNHGLVAAAIAISLGITSLIVAAGLCLRSILMWWSAAILVVAVLLLGVWGAVLGLQSGDVLGLRYCGGIALLFLVMLLALIGVRGKFGSLLDSRGECRPRASLVLHIEAHLRVLRRDEGYDGGPLYSGLLATFRCGEIAEDVHVVLVGASQLAQGEEGTARLSFVRLGQVADMVREGTEFELLDDPQRRLCRGAVSRVLLTSASPGRRRR